jgi:hypothetical protein
MEKPWVMVLERGVGGMEHARMVEASMDDSSRVNMLVCLGSGFMVSKMYKWES